MSHIVTKAVLESALPSRLKLVALALADFAASDGTRVYPSVQTICRMSGRKRRSVQNALAELRELSILRPLDGIRGGRNRPNRYSFNVDALPKHDDETAQRVQLRARDGAHRQRESALTQRDECAHVGARIGVPGGVELPVQRAQVSAESVQSTQQRAQPLAPDPSVDLPLIHQEITKPPLRRTTQLGKNTGGQGKSDGFRRLCVIARDCLEAKPGDCQTDRTELIKTAASRAGLLYTTELVWKAMDAVDHTKAGGAR